LEGVVRYGEDIATSYEVLEIRTSEEPSCYDGIKNQEETGVDCGGKCEPCSQGSCKDGIKNNGETGVDCGGTCSPCNRETCNDGIKNQDETGIDCGGRCKSCDAGIVPDNQEIIEKVKALGTVNEEESIRLCNTLTDEDFKDECYLQIAQIFEKHSHCDSIERASLSNVCYMHFVQLGDYSVCEKIQDVYIRKSCESLRQIENIMESEE